MGLHFKILFSTMLESGIRIRIIVKYKTDATCPIIINGCSTGWPPIQVSVRRSATKSQYMHWLMGRKIILRCLELWRNGTIARIRIERTRATTPPSLLGIDRRIA